MDLLERALGDVDGTGLRIGRSGQGDEDAGDVHARRLGENLARHGADDVLGLLGCVHKEDDLAGGLGDPLGLVRFPVVAGQSTRRAPGCRRTSSEELMRNPLFELGQQGGGTDAVPQPR